MPNQGHTYGISNWIPYYGTGCSFTDKYSSRSYFVPCYGFGGTTPDTKRAYDECSKVAPLMLGDYYPLTPYSLQPTDWIAWQFNQPETGRGVVQAFRREKNQQAASLFRLTGLSPSAKYLVTNFDAPAPISMSGKELMDRGLPIDIPSTPGSAVITYRKEK
jgi:alpha-galactosidase